MAQQTLTETETQKMRMKRVGVILLSLFSILLAPSNGQKD